MDQERILQRVRKIKHRKLNTRNESAIAAGYTADERPVARLTAEV